MPNVGGYVTELTFDATELVRDDGTLILWLTKGLLAAPSVRGTDWIIPQAAGRWARSRQADTLDLELEGWVLGTDPTSGYATLEAVMELFDGVAAPRVLAGVLPDGRGVSINARPVPPVLAEEKVPGHVWRVNVALVSIDPYWTITPAES